MKKLILLISIGFLFSCEKEQINKIEADQCEPPCKCGITTDVYISGARFYGKITNECSGNTKSIVRDTMMDEGGYICLEECW